MMMVDLYELQIVAGGDPFPNGNAYRVEQRFHDLPELETIAALKDEAADSFAHLFGEAPEAIQVVCLRLPGQDIAYQTGTAQAIYKEGALQ